MDKGPIANSATHLTARARALIRSLITALIGTLIGATLWLSGALFVNANAPINSLPPGSRRAAPSRALKAAAAPMDRAFAEANKLKSEWTERSLLSAIGLYSEARRHAITERNPKAESDALRFIGESYFTLGRYGEATRAYERALPLSRKLHDRHMEADILNGLGEAELDENAGSALKRFDSARAISKATDYPAGAARSLIGVGTIESNRSNPAKALALLNEALSFFISAEDQIGRVDALLNIAYVHADMGEIAKALELFREAADVAGKSGDRRRKALAESAIGLMQTALGDIESARASHRSAVDALSAIGDRISLGVALNSLGYFNQELGDYAYARSCFERALEIWTKSHQVHRQAISLGLLGRLYESQGDIRAALTSYKKRLRLSGRDVRQQAYTLADMGSIYDSAGNLGMAKRCYARSLSLGRPLNYPRILAFATNNLGRIEHRLHHYEKARGLYQSALKLILAAGDRRGQTFVINNIARLKRDQGDLDGALAEATKLMEMIDSQRNSLPSADLQASYFASVYPHYQLYADLLMLKHKDRPNDGFDALAFQQSENGRARSLTEMLIANRTNFREGVNEEMAARRRDLQLLLDNKANQQIRLLGSRYAVEQSARTPKAKKAAAATVAQLTEKIAVLEKEIDETRQQLQNLEADINRTSPKYSALTVPPPLSVTSVQQEILDENTIALEYLVGDERSYLWLIGPGIFRTFVLPGREVIERSAFKLIEELSRDPREHEGTKRARSNIDQRSASFLKLSRQLTDLILPSSLAQFGVGNKRLVIIPDGALQYVPFGLLLSPGNDTFVFERSEVVSLPSLSALVELRKDAGRRTPSRRLLAMIADPVFDADDDRIPGAVARAASDFQSPKKSRTRGSSGRRTGSDSTSTDRGIAMGLSRLRVGEEGPFHQLAFARAEASAIEAIAQGQDVVSIKGLEAGKSAVLNMDLSEFKIVHFATHSRLDLRHPELSCIVLSQRDATGAEQDGFLRLNDIYNLKLSADLVVLSACQTALGRDVRGEGLVGLTRGFMYAGATSVVASLWKIDDEASKELMAKFYGHMLGPNNLSPAAALREAQKEIMSIERWRHPYFWAAFVMQGEWRPPKR